MPDQWSAQLTARWEGLADELKRRLGPGTRLEPTERNVFETALGHDVSGVVLHRTGLARELAAAHAADALSADRHILGAAERLDPTSVRGRALIGHELTHVVRGGLAQPTTAAASPIIQRALADPAQAGAAEEPMARVVEAQLLGRQQQQPGTDGGRRPVDLEAVVEGVYRRLVEELRVEQERAPWL
jgi:hypothetical protein